MAEKKKKKPDALEVLTKRVDLLEMYVFTTDVPAKNDIATQLRALKEKSNG